MDSVFWTKLEISVQDNPGQGQSLYHIPVVSFCPFSFRVPVLKPNGRKKGTLIIKGLLGDLDTVGT